MSKILKIYTDGACKGNPGPGGWGAILIWGDSEKKIKGYKEYSTNNAMELTAAIEALKAVKNKNVNIELYTDSKYVKDGIKSWLPRWEENNWKGSRKTEIKNIELWKSIAELRKQFEIEWYWVKGHSGDKYNEIADRLANEAIEENQ